MSSRAQAVLARLEATWERWWLYSFVTGIVMGGCVSFGLLATFISVDAFLRLPRGGLAALFAVWGLVTAALIALLALRLLRFRRSLAGTARRVELDSPEIGSHLINLVQFSHDDEGGTNGEFRRAALEQAAAAVADVPFHEAASKQSRRRRFLLCMQTPRDLLESSGVLVVVVVLTLLLYGLVPSWAGASRRVLRPWTFVPAIGRVQIVKVEPGTTEVLMGSGVEVAATIANPEGRPHGGRLFVTREGERETALPLLADATHTRYTAALPQVLGPLRYRVEIGDSQSEAYRIGVFTRPTVSSVEIEYTYPDYLGLPPTKVTQKDADLEAPRFTTAALRIHPSAPVASGHVQWGDRKINGYPSDDGMTFRVELPLDESGPFTVHWTTPSGHTDPEPRVNQVRAMDDAPPTATLLSPPREVTVKAGGSVLIVVRAGDDHGLSEVRIEGRSRDDEVPRVLASWKKFGAGEATLNHTLELKDDTYQAGQTVQVRAVARDRREVDRPALHLGPQETATAWHKVEIADPKTQASAELAQLDGIRAALWKVFQEQVKARLATAGITDATVAQAAPKVLDQQTRVRNGSLDIVRSIGPTTDEDRLVLKRIVNKLALGDMLEAVNQAEALAGAKDLAAANQALMATQDRIIDALRRVLEAVRRETSDLLAEMKARPDTELPADVQSRMRDLKDKLAEFLKQQRKIIEATEELAKKPVDDFTEEDKEALEKLAATEDDWSRFMSEEHTDFSKLPEQDLSNPSLLQELVAVENELKMAKDALTKKTADIAVPLEQLGAEMAEEMTTNIEKWLPDTPDRERWSQEEPITDDMKEAPLAELPQELEDIVGELMEEEEDLFDEMEDVTSSWADSLDKGAGWDAMDGPISNNSARGVTGNRLPNTSEIAGRSGEGRQGRASGEFVADSAVGKGGRKTPSRLGNDAFVKGEVKDTSKDPVGGATGGGKESGQGGEGLQGPVPKNRDKNKELQRLAEKQAELRNKAEGINLKYPVMRYHHADIAKQVEQMKAVEDDLRGGLYRNALRRREVLVEGLGQMKTYLHGDFLVRRDQTANLPADIQKEVLGSMGEASPAGWEALNRKYYERLAAEPPAPSGPKK